jgi:hypothetical protein
MIFLRSKYLLFFLITICISLFSCATLFTGIKNKVVIDSFPQDAEVKINGMTMGRTPVKVNLTRTIFKKKKVQLSKEGFKSEEYTLKRKFNAVALLSNIYIPIDFLTGAAVIYSPKYYNTQLTQIDSSHWKGYNLEDGNKCHIWNKNIRLTWDFFQGDTKNLTTDKFLKTGAATSSWFNCSYVYNDSLLELYSYSIFSTHHSWVKEKSRYALNHEQKHFDISELYSRKFKKKLMECTFTPTNIDSTITAVYKEYEEKLLSAQIKYDTETGHSINTAMQETWDTMIEKELEKTNNFEKAYYQINLKK